MNREQKNKVTKKCQECKFAIYCYSEESTWTFRTKEEMQQTLREIYRCDIFKQMRRSLGYETASERAGECSADKVPHEQL